MARNAHFPVYGTFDRASRVTKGTVTIDRAASLITVRRSRARKTYTLPLDTVANMIVQRIVKAEVFQKRMERAKKKR